MPSRSKTPRSKAIIEPPTRERYVTLTARAGLAGWHVVLTAAKLIPLARNGRATLTLSFRATLIRDGVAVAEASGRDLDVDGLPSVVWRDARACDAFVARCRNWWPDARESDATVGGHVIRELVAEGVSSGDRSVAAPAAVSGPHARRPSQGAFGAVSRAATPPVPSMSSRSVLTTNGGAPRRPGTVAVRRPCDGR